jgi:DNA-binding NarL/FixJ family response regulator
MQSRPRVLLAEDHPGVVRALERVLSSHCDVIGMVADGSQVPPAAALLEPVISVIDLNLPTINGFEACRRIVRRDPHAKVIVITATMDEAVRTEALAAGAFGCFSKLMAGTELIDAIREAWVEVSEPDAEDQS